MAPRSARRDGWFADQHRASRGAEPGEAPLVEKGLLRDWLIAGPFAVVDSLQNFDQDLLNGETTLEPAADQKAANKVWKKFQGPRDDFMVFGTADVPWLDLTKEFSFKPNQLAYLHTYLYSPRGGPARNRRRSRFRP